MYPILFRKAILPALDRLNGTRVAALVSLLEDSERWPLDRLIGFQREKLARLRAWTAQHSAFYRAHWHGAAEDRRAESEYPELSGLPIVNKMDLRRAVGQFPLPAYRGPLRDVRTSGSTACP